VLFNGEEGCIYRADFRVTRYKWCEKKSMPTCLAYPASHARNLFFLKNPFEKSRSLKNESHVWLVQPPMSENFFKNSTDKSES
jgi:hypothetical protein